MSDCRPRDPGQKPGDAIEVDEILEEQVADQFEDAPATDPTVPAIPDPGAPVPDVEPAVLFAPTLPEMEADIWQAGMEALVSVSEAVLGPPAPDEWNAEAQLYRDESALSATPEEGVALLVAAGRAAQAAGDAESAARGFDEALTRAPTSPEALRARARLAESLGEYDQAHGFWARLALAAPTPDERAFYAALSAEWTLARRGSLPATAVDAIPPGPARAVALAENALREGAGAAAGALAAAGRALGAPREAGAGTAATMAGAPAMGAAFIEQAARVALTARDANAASAYLAAARRIAPAEPGIALAALAGAARSSGRDAEKRLAEVLPGLPPGSPLTEAVRRWAAALARARGDVATARDFLAPEPSGLAAARDRLDLDAAAGAPLSAAALERARAGAGSPAAAATLVGIEAESLRREGDVAAVTALLAAALEAAPDATPLGLLAEEAADAASDPESRAAALEIWLRADDARRAPAALLLAEARAASGSSLNARAALQTALEAAPMSAVFWDVAGEDARAGRRADGAAVLAYGAEIWRGSALEAPLRACAAAKLAPADPGRALAMLEISPEGKLSPAGAALGTESVARLAERAGSREALAAALEAAAAGTEDPALKAWIQLRHASSVPPSDSGARAIAFEEALRVAPAHPLALPIYLAEPAVDVGNAASALARAGRDGGVPSFARLASLAAVGLHAASADHAGALRAAQELLAASPGDREARGQALRAALALGEPRGPSAAAAIDGTAADRARDDLHLLAIAEARLLAGDEAAAREAFGALEGGRFAADARRFAARAGGTSAPLPPGLLATPADAEAVAAAEALRRIRGRGLGRQVDRAGHLAVGRTAPRGERGAGHAGGRDRAGRGARSAGGRRASGGHGRLAGSAAGCRAGDPARSGAGGGHGGRRVAARGAGGGHRGLGRRRVGLARGGLDLGGAGPRRGRAG